VRVIIVQEPRLQRFWMDGRQSGSNANRPDSRHYIRPARHSGEIVRQCVMNNMESERFRFGLFEFDTATRELRREGVLVRLQSQPAQVLACLIALAGQVVSREELRKMLWGGETFVDFDRGVNFCISQIRSALRDQSIQHADRG
jgi:DNA-binding response OmpR family regulator